MLQIRRCPAIAALMNRIPARPDRQATKAALPTDASREREESAHALPTKTGPANARLTTAAAAVEAAQVEAVEEAQVGAAREEREDHRQIQR